MLDTSTQPTGRVTQVTGPSRRTRRGRKVAEQVPRHLRAHLTAYLMIAPMVILLGIFVIWPLVYAFYLSFFEMSFYKDAKFVGFDFYQYVLTDRTSTRRCGSASSWRSWSYRRSSSSRCCSRASSRRCRSGWRRS
ncbi:hypothetical protein [Kribbella sp. NPDC051137]|uniref:hypothetical protein n=1 Tax=Kribbella sp. NPDC051137 TaxID=3155045 RepID=UPI003412EBE7